jgi:hypothetical protein
MHCPQSAVILQRVTIADKKGGEALSVQVWNRKLKKSTIENWYILAVVVDIVIFFTKKPCGDTYICINY